MCYIEFKTTLRKSNEIRPTRLAPFMPQAAYSHEEVAYVVSRLTSYYAMTCWID